MNARHRSRILASTLLAAVLACAAAVVSAQTVFKVVDAGGKITFTDHPETTPSAQEASTPDADAAHPTTRISGISSRRAAAIVDANESARRLQQAQLKRKQGIAPLPGEQARGARGGTVNERYWRRQEQLRLLVEQAQRRQRETAQPQLASR
jgi:hypothetical protein